MKAVIYARYSSSKQTEQSIDGQKRVCLDYAKQNNLEIVGEYIDRAISGTTSKRPQFLKMIADAEKSNFEAIIVYKLDRFSRNRYDSVIFKKKLKDSGVKVVSAMERISEGADGIIIESIHESMAELFSIDLSQKIKRGMKESFLKQNFRGGIPLLGYKVKDKKIFIDEDSSQAVKYMFEKYANGDSPTKLAKALNNKGYRTSKGYEFVPGSFYKLLSNKKYIGIYEYDGEICYKTYPEIISKDLFDKVQQRLQLKIGKRANGSYEKANYLLSGKVFCGICGSKMTGMSGNSKKSGKHLYYSCSNRRKKHFLINNKPCSKPNDKKEELEYSVIKRIADKVITKDNICDIAEKLYAINNDGSLEKEIQSLEQKNKRLDIKIENIVNLFIEAIGDKELLKSLKQKHRDLIVEKKDNEFEISKLQTISTDSFSESKEDAIAILRLMFSILPVNEKDKEDMLESYVNSIFVFKKHTLTFYSTNSNLKAITHKEMLERIPPKLKKKLIDQSSEDKDNKDDDSNNRGSGNTNTLIELGNGKVRPKLRTVYQYLVRANLSVAFTDSGS
jgi:DNA invertase Pin-like site-specific DNA recombinase/uncharacterized Zn finger protein (UPF0148 family)